MRRFSAIRVCWILFQFGAIGFGEVPISGPSSSQKEKSSTASIATLSQESRDQEGDRLIAHIRSLGNASLSKEHTEDRLEFLKSTIAESPHLLVVREANEALGKQLIKLSEELEFVAHQDEEAGLEPLRNLIVGYYNGELPTFAASGQLQRWIDAGIVSYWSGLKRIEKEKMAFPLGLRSLTERVKPSEDLARRMIRLIQDPNPILRTHVLSLVTSKSYNQEIRDNLSQIAVHLVEQDPSNEVKKESLLLMGRLGKRGPEAKRKAIATLRNTLGNAHLEDHALQAIEEWGEEAKELVPDVKTFFVKRAVPENSAFALGFLRAHSTDDETIAMARDFLLDKASIGEEALFEAFLLLVKNDKLPLLPVEVEKKFNQQARQLFYRYTTAVRQNYSAKAEHWEKRGGLIAKERIESLDAAFVDAVKKWQLDRISDLLARGADIRTDEDAAVRWAARKGRMELLEYLMQRGGNIHSKNEEALRMAAENDFSEVVKLCVEHQADVHADEDEAFRWAALNGNFEMMEFLVAHGADPRTRSDEALRSAMSQGNQPVVIFLKQLISQTEIRE